ncbi:conserved Plasmodium protein, unknown function [Plasmodium knowlesi strain H]|uniref:Uncharacterized protein n=3 Tax=Plasmodium knowlesi TaxID=5850 RepID=A0A5K1UCZ7_PLAKH|nr:conserved Plasmodium protein, unknown function [Plasmodium knowlesi strain H]OTN66296.1 Uncharacterized protein PKNOH_S09511400 [Plasmodium knowlesi]CAA9986287.1 conserved Plasmodium protein, unknown function [Plasmodium knowlesi strain H]SBO25509.1 conserved Plasmodium protein, unknown function [Plasmodium knowlesi strain H]SBO28273.1 conserved Plasmodium protein, unknown function [Plasmodium knowlesi strain H]VVS75761.1 conserved Plasmodium protein, unknown function [Plasmodium knowlesi s|eukprot:XP_002257692.1 hypothetical protein, conserved in Plasmodium species [Plasmodium knowlesi strain H]
MAFYQSEKKNRQSSSAQNIEEGTHNLGNHKAKISQGEEEVPRKATWSDAHHALKVKNGSGSQGGSRNRSRSEGQAAGQEAKQEVGQEGDQATGQRRSSSRNLNEKHPRIDTGSLADEATITVPPHSKEGPSEVANSSGNTCNVPAHEKLSDKVGGTLQDTLRDTSDGRVGKIKVDKSLKLPNPKPGEKALSQLLIHPSVQVSTQLPPHPTMNSYQSDAKKNNYLMRQAVFFTPKKNCVIVSNEKKEIGNRIGPNGNDEHPLNSTLHKNGAWVGGSDQRKTENYGGTIWKSKDTLLSFNTDKHGVNHNKINLNTAPVSSPHSFGAAENTISGGEYSLSGGHYAAHAGQYGNCVGEYTVGGTEYGGGGGGEYPFCSANNCSVSSSLTLQGNNFNSPNIGNMNFLQNGNTMSGKVGGGAGGGGGNINEGSLEYLNISSQCFAEKKKDIVYLFQELLSYCECLKRNRKKSTEEINKIRISYNKVSDLLKETLKREKNSHIKIEELRNIIITYDEKLDRVKNSSEGTISNLNKNVQTLIDLNNNLEMEMNKVANENQQLRKIAQNEFNLNKEINELRNQIEILNNEKVVLVNQIDGLRLENSKIENEKNVLLSDKTLLHCKIDELENGLKNKNKNNIFNQANGIERESNPFIINSDEEINQQVNNYLNLNHEQRTELFKNFLYHWRETNKAGQKFYEQSCVAGAPL